MSGIINEYQSRFVPLFAGRRGTFPNPVNPYTGKQIDIDSEKAKRPPLPTCLLSLLCVLQDLVKDSCIYLSVVIHMTHTYEEEEK